MATFHDSRGKMKSDLKFFLWALAIATTLYIATMSFTSYAERRSSSVEAACLGEIASQTTKADFNKAESQVAPWNRDWGVKLEDHAACPHSANELTGAKVLQEFASSLSSLYAVAILVLMIGITPMIWYFFLRRLSEVADAVRRK